jgi:glutaminyl-tRNA synthetase
MRKVKGTLHWVSAEHALDVEVRVYDRLFTEDAPDSNKERDFMEFVNPNSLEVVTAKAEPSLKNASVEQVFQFQRLGYFAVDRDSKEDYLIFNKTVGLKDSWKPITEKQ